MPLPSAHILVVLFDLWRRKSLASALSGEAAGSGLQPQLASLLPKTDSCIFHETLDGLAY